jgi:hypothetical protein
LRAKAGRVAAACVSASAYRPMRMPRSFLSVSFYQHHIVTSMFPCIFSILRGNLQNNGGNLQNNGGTYQFLVFRHGFYLPHQSSILMDDW